MPKVNPALAFIIYEEDLGKFGQTIEELLHTLHESLHLPLIASPCHDSDITHYLVGDKPEKPHYHVFLNEPAYKSTKDQISTSLSVLSEGNININHFEDINNPATYFAYLTHSDLSSIAEGKHDYSNKPYAYVSEDFVAPTSHNKVFHLYKVARCLVTTWLGCGEYEHTREEFEHILIDIEPNAVNSLCLTTFKTLWNMYEDVCFSHLNTAQMSIDKAIHGSKGYKEIKEDESGSSNNDTSNPASCSGPCADIVDVPLTERDIQTTLKGLKKTSPKTDGDDYKKEITRK